MVLEILFRIMGVYDCKGLFQKGKDVDILIFDQDLNICVVWVMGKLVEGICIL